MTDGAPETAASQRPLSFAIVTDLHLLEGQGLARWSRFVDALGRHDDLAFVLVLGDLMWDGPAEGIKARLERLPAAAHVLYGNNDATRLDEYEPVLGPRDWQFDYGGYRFVGLWNARSPRQEQNHRGGFSEEQWQVLESACRAAAAGEVAGTFLASHVPPAMPDGLNPSFFMFEDQSERLKRLCFSDHPPKACFFGHVHQDSAWRQGGTEIIVTPSMNWNFQAVEPVQSPHATRVRVCQEGFYRLVTVGRGGIRHRLYGLPQS